LSKGTCGHVRISSAFRLAEKRTRDRRRCRLPLPVAYGMIAATEF
jgi:hypothetical protein